MELRIALSLLLVSQIISTALASKCTTANLTTNPDDCIMAIREAILDTDRFWFGSDFSTRCSGQSAAFSVDCSSLFPPTSGPYSMASLVFWQNTFEANLIKNFMEVKYTSMPGSYTGCGTTVVRNATQMFRLDPLSPDAYPPWDARSMPEITWPKEDGKMYSLFIIDVGFGFVHGIYLNIEGDLSSLADVGRSTVIKAYNGPKNFRRIPNPYVFILYEQTDRVTVTDQWLAIINNPLLKFNVSDFQEQFQLKGPIAVNWLLASYDAYSLNFQRNIIDNCASLVQDKVTVYHSNRPWIKMTGPLTVNVHVNFKVEAMEFEVCCKDFSYSSDAFAIDPLGSKVLLPVMTRTGQTVELKLSMSGPPGDPAVQFKDKHYTMLMVDPDVPKPLVGTNARPLVHWLMINMAVDADGKPEGGSTIHGYRGPAPPDQKDHHYYYLLFEQKGELMMENSNAFAGDCPDTLAGKCLFDVEKFQNNLNLTLVGLSWMVAHNDYYTNYTKVAGGQDPDQFCKWTPGYNNPCGGTPAENTDGTTDDNAAVSHLVSITLIFSCFIWAANLKW